MASLSAAVATFEETLADGSIELTIKCPRLTDQLATIRREYEEIPVGEREPWESTLRDKEHDVADVTRMRDLLEEERQDKPTEITPRVVLGNQHAAKDSAVLTELKVTHVLNVAFECDDPEVVIGLDAGGFPRYRHLKIFDSPKENLLKHLPATLEWMDNVLLASPEHKIFVHCQRGASRSAALVMGYVMRELKLSYPNAFQYVKDRRPVVKPNAGFLQQLQKYEMLLKETDGNV